MNQRTVVIALVVICLMTVVGLVGLRGWAGLEKTSNSPGCFDIRGTLSSCTPYVCCEQVHWGNLAITGRK